MNAFGGSRTECRGGKLGIRLPAIQFLIKFEKRWSRSLLKGHAYVEIAGDKSPGICRLVDPL
jgi:hypothetical protein